MDSGVRTVGDIAELGDTEEVNEVLADGRAHKLRVKLTCMLGRAFRQVCRL